MVLAGFHGKYVNWLKPFFIERESHEKTLCLKNGTPHSRYFSDELGVPIILIDTEQMFVLQRDAWYNINVNIVYYLRKKNYFRR